MVTRAMCFVLSCSRASTTQHPNFLVLWYFQIWSTTKISCFDRQWGLGNAIFPNAFPEASPRIADHFHMLSDGKSDDPTG